MAIELEIFSLKTLKPLVFIEAKSFKKTHSSQILK